MKTHEYKGKDITITYQVSRCIHAAECVHGSRPAFDPDRKPWINPDAASPDALAAVIRRCPTGALHYVASNPGLAEQPDPSNTVTTQPDGPLYLRGRISVRSESGEELLSDTRVALCRCGASKNKPFCDNSHFAIAFEDSALAQPGPDAATEMATTGKLAIVPGTNGPLHLQGQVTIRNAGGQTIFEGAETWLCRCGGSGNKPFCDGSHNKIGFRSES